MGEEQLKLRTAAEPDVPELVELIESAYRGESSRAGWTTEADLLGGQRTDSEAVRTVIKDPDSRMLVAEHPAVPEGPVACCQLERRGEQAYFGMFAVRPGQQGRGLGRRVLTAAEHTAVRDWSAREMHMTVIVQRADLIAWYERRGYVRTGNMSPFPYGDERFGLPQRPDLAFELLVKRLD